MMVVVEGGERRLGVQTCHVTSFPLSERLVNAKITGIEPFKLSLTVEKKQS